MKNNQKSPSFFPKQAFFALVVVLACGMGAGEEKVSGPLQPSFADLVEGAGMFHGAIRDNSASYQLEKISFSGQTILERIRRETDDSTTNIDIAKIREIKVNRHNFNSERYSDKEYTLVTITTRKGEQINDLLIPRKVVICGVDKKTELEKAWFINKIDNITFEDAPVEEAAPTKTPPDSLTEKPKGIITKVKEAGTSAVQAATSAVKQVGQAIVSGVKKASDYLNPGSDEKE